MYLKQQYDMDSNKQSIKCKSLLLSFALKRNVRNGIEQTSRQHCISNLPAAVRNAVRKYKSRDYGRD